uniref:Uncharacterized protein n=1 Tax=Zea mays TaxID=4577 RepID=C0P8X8_MAIZE|nr:unknown [Zea mays]
MSHAPMQRATSEQEARISSRTVVSPATGRTLAAALLSLRAVGPIVGGLYTPGELLLVVAAALGVAGYVQPLPLGSLLLSVAVPEKTQACGFWLLRW